MKETANRISKELGFWHRKREFSALGDRAIIVTFGEEIGMDVYEKVQRLFQALQQHPFTGMIECVPSFTSLAVYYNLYEVWKEIIER